MTCKIPLNVAQSPQADRERAFIQGLIDRGESEGQIKTALVGQYGPAVLGLPEAHGFDLAAYLVPLAVVLARRDLLCCCTALAARANAAARGRRLAQPDESRPARRRPGARRGDCALHLPRRAHAEQSTERAIVLLLATHSAMRNDSPPARRLPRDSPGRTR